MIKFIQYVVDTNILINYLLEDLINIHEGESKPVETFNYTRASNTLVPYFILTEFEITLKKAIPRKYNLSKEAESVLIKNCMEFIRNFEKYGSVLQISSETYINARKLFSELNPRTKLSLADVTLAVITKSLGANLLTSDKELMKFYRELTL